MPENRIYLDTEFLDTGSLIAPLSWGLVADDGATYYAVNASMPQTLVFKDDFHRAQTMPYFPQSRWPESPPCWLDERHPDVKKPSVIRDEIEEFFAFQHDDHGDVELWANYAAHDFIVLTQLWGPLMNVPAVVPWYIHDLRVERRRLGLNVVPEDFPVQTEGRHHALHDARFDKVMGDWMINFEQERKLYEQEQFLREQWKRERESTGGWKNDG